MAVFVNTFHPLCKTAYGRKLAVDGKYPPFIDGSIRREPDLESNYPSISALCRLTKFAPRLRKSDIVVYMTIKRKFYKKPNDRRLVAILKVIERYETHRDAAGFYQARGLSLPKNCMVSSNPPLNVRDSAEPKKNTCQWDADYNARAKQVGVFLVTKALYRELYQPPIIDDHVLNDVFGKTPGTQTPKRIDKEQYQKLLELLGLKVP